MRLKHIIIICHQKEFPFHQKIKENHQEKKKKKEDKWSQQSDNKKDKDEKSSKKRKSNKSKNKNEEKNILCDKNFSSKINNKMKIIEEECNENIQISSNSIITDIILIEKIKTISKEKKKKIKGRNYINFILIGSNEVGKSAFCKIGRAHV